MNIFVVDLNPAIAGRSLCDKHIVKQVLEACQLLCSAFQPGTAPYRRTHYNHPCAIWARQSYDNYLWLLEHGYALAAEYNRRYQKIHKCEEVLTWAAVNGSKLSFPEKGLTPFAQAMPEEYKDPDPVVAYRNYYRGAKRHIATWRHPAQPPEWW